MKLNALPPPYIEIYIFSLQSTDKHLLECAKAFRIQSRFDLPVFYSSTNFLQNYEVERFASSIEESSYKNRET